MSQQRTRALGIVKAAARLKVLAARMREKRENGAHIEEPAGLGIEEALLGTSPPGLSDGTPNGSSPTPPNGGPSPPPSFTRVSRVSDYGGRPPPPPPPSSTRGASVLEVVAPKWFMRDYVAVSEIFLASWINLLLVCIPLGFASEAMGWGPVATFSLNFLSLIPLALILGDVTEDLALRFGDVIGGLINATFGNVVEVILSLTALTKGLNDVVAASLLGSILSNLLLVLGCSFFFGGLYHKTQTFNAVGNRACSSLLMLACIGIIIPTAATKLVDAEDSHEEWILDISRGTAVLLLACYAAYLVFQLRTHHDLFQPDDGQEAEPILSLTTATLLLTAITVVVAFASEFLTGSIEDVSEQTKLSQAFLGMIVLPIAGNACEHITAVVVATKNKMDLSLGVAVGSSIQIALFAIPLAVVFGWVTGNPFSLSFDSFSALVLTVCVIHSNFVTSDATSHWLLGTQLIAVYCLIALAYFYR